MKPILQALVVADHIYEDKATGKKVVAGIFHKIYFRSKESLDAEAKEQGGKIVAPRGGFQSGSPFAYVSLTEVPPGPQEFVGRYVDLKDDRVLLQLGFTIRDVADPLQIVEITIPLPALPAQQQGAFALELLWRDEPLGSYRIIVEELPDSQGDTK